jgi:amidohydrolase
MDVKAGAKEKVSGIRDHLLDLSHRIHADPELRYEEVHASALLAESLAKAGFAVETGVCDLPTAFIARAGSGPLHIAICAEYDALPGVGHACGHNMIAAMAVGAGIAAAQIADDAGLTISVIGTPAEEGGGGKIYMLERGGFKGVHAAMMIHPTPTETPVPDIIAASRLEVRYTGRSAHAAMAPEMGINAADAMTVAQTAIALLRQQILPTDRIHGIVTDGGDAPNIIPAHTAAMYSVRSRTAEQLARLRPRVDRCFEAGALATGATLEIIEGIKYAQMQHDMGMAEVYQRNAEAVGRRFSARIGEPQEPGFSTDMGNISLAIPSIHPNISIDCSPAVNHQPEFAAHCITEVADKAVVDGALAMAWTAIDLAQDAEMLKRLTAKVSA